MLRLTELSVVNFRSITNRIKEIKFNDLTVFVGANNTGKSNIMRALDLFFNGSVEGKPHNPAIDFFKKNYESSASRPKIKITVTMKYNEDMEISIEKAIKEIETNTNQKRLPDSQIKLVLSYTKGGIEEWRFLGRKGSQNISKDLLNNLKDAIRSSLKFKYIPVSRDSLEIIKNEIGNELIKTIFSGWSGSHVATRDISGAIENLLSKLEVKLSKSSSDVTDSMKEVFREIKKIKLALPFSDLESLLPSLVPKVEDEYETNLEVKGAGIQTSSLLFLLKYLADNHPSKKTPVTFIWAIEEPESFLHPEQQRNIAKVIKDFSSDVQTIITTHCPHFIFGNDSNSAVYVIGKNRKDPYGTEIIGKDYETARQSLGVSLLDSMYLHPLNFVVEGISDEIILSGVLEVLEDDPDININRADVKFFPSTNAISACVLFETLFDFCSAETKDVKICLIIDGDRAGGKALRGLCERMQSKKNVNLQANHHYFQLPSDIEELTPDSIIERLEKTHSSQVSVTRDINDKRKKFKITGPKEKIAQEIIRLIKENKETKTSQNLEGYKKIFKRIQNSL